MSFVGILERSGVTVDAALLEARLKTRKYAGLNDLRCAASIDVAAALDRAKGRWEAKAFEAFKHGTFEQRQAAYRFPGKCFADLARKAVLKTVELFREVTCIVHDDDYKDCVHICAECEDHFRGVDVEIDHSKVGFYEILVAFLDSHVANWCILPDAETVTKKSEHNYGYRSRIKQAHRVETAETECAYWQRVTNASKRRWSIEGLDEQFIAFHNSVVKLQTLCRTCHDHKTNREAAFGSGPTYVRRAEPVYIEALGKSNKRKRNDELIERTLQEEATLLDNERIKALLTGLREAIVSMERTQIVDALGKVPPALRDVIPLVKTATYLLNDIDLYDTGEAQIELNPLPTDPFGKRTATICWSA